MGDGGWTDILMLFMLRVLPWLFVAVGAWLLFSAWRFLGGAERRHGRVVELHRSTSFRQSSQRTMSSQTVTSYKPVFEYEDDSGTARAETPTFSTRQNFPVGTEMDILVNRASPGVARLPGAGNYALGGALFGIGLVFGIVGLLAPI